MSSDAAFCSRIDFTASGAALDATGLVGLLPALILPQNLAETSAMRSICLLITLLVTVAATAQESRVENENYNLRVENEIYIEAQKDPAIRTLTLFSGDLVYDFSFALGEGKNVEQATLYDFTSGRFIVVDYTKKAKIEVNQEMLLQVLSEISGKVQVAKSPLLKEMASPHFETTVEEGLHTFSGKNLKYEVRTIEPQTKRAARDYQRFADWSARLTTALQNGSPPMARIKVNEAIANAGLMPKEVTLTRSEGAIWENAKKLRSEHHVNWAHTKTDANRIEVLNSKMAEAKSITKLSEFRALHTAAKPDEKKR